MQNSITTCKHIDICKFNSLDKNLRDFLLAFIRYKGKLTKIRREMNITRNEAKHLNNELLSIVTVIPIKSKQNLPKNKFPAITEHMGNRYVFNMFNR